MYVEAVHGDGTITVSDYNLGWDGLYRYYTRSASGLTYVYF
jgi:surface antigen